jgi:hypothetical protein
MKSDVDDKAPNGMPKSQRAEIERRQKEDLIQLNNRLLLDRLAMAMSVKNIDNERKKINFISLMEGKKKRENTRIENDNRRLLHAIQHTVPVYNHIMWERDAEKRVHVLKNMTTFPDLLEDRIREAKQAKSEIKEVGRAQQKSLLHKLDKAIINQLSKTGSTSLDSGGYTSTLSPMSSPGKNGRNGPWPVSYGGHSPLPSPGSTSSSMPNSPFHHASSSSTPSLAFAGDALDGEMAGDAYYDDQGDQYF